MKKPYNPATEKPYFIDEEGARNYDYDNTIRYLQYKGRVKFGKHFRIHKEDLTIISKLASLLHQVRKLVRKTQP